MVAIRWYHLVARSVRVSSTTDDGWSVTGKQRSAVRVPRQAGDRPVYRNVFFCRKLPHCVSSGYRFPENTCVAAPATIEERQPAVPVLFK